MPINADTSDLNRSAILKQFETSVEHVQVIWYVLRMFERENQIIRAKIDGETRAIMCMRRQGIKYIVSNCADLNCWGTCTGGRFCNPGSSRFASCVIKI